MVGAEAHSCSRFELTLSVVLQFRIRCWSFARMERGVAVIPSFDYEVEAQLKAPRTGPVRAVSAAKLGIHRHHTCARHVLPFFVVSEVKAPRCQRGQLLT